MTTRYHPLNIQSAVLAKTIEEEDQGEAQQETAVRGGRSGSHGASSNLNGNGLSVLAGEADDDAIKVLVKEGFLRTRPHEHSKTWHMRYYQRESCCIVTTNVSHVASLLPT